MTAYFLHLGIMKMRQVMYEQRNIEERSRTIVAVENKKVQHILNVCLQP